jgi:hypothetical protein
MLLTGKTFPYTPLGPEGNANLLSGFGIDAYKDPLDEPSPEVFSLFYKVTRETVLSEGDPPAITVVSDLGRRCAESMGVDLEEGAHAFEEGAVLYSAMLHHDTRTKGIPFEFSVYRRMTLVDSQDLALSSMTAAPNIPDVPRIMSIAEPAMTARKSPALRSMTLAGVGELHALVTRSVAERMKRDPDLVEHPELIAETNPDRH